MNFDENHTLGDRVAIAFSRVVTRRRLLRQAAQAAAATAVATGFRLTWPGSADAALCTFSVSTWGCYCASTPFCGSDRCCFDGGNAYDSCCGGATRRASYWTTYPHCWCSQNCCLSQHYNMYSCCDCWMYGVTGSNPCICKASVYRGRC